MLEDLKDLGLAYQRDANSRFYPTRLATMLTSQNAAINDVSRESFIVLETNFKLYAYTGKLPEKKRKKNKKIFFFFSSLVQIRHYKSPCSICL